MIELGHKIKNRVSGREGIATGRVEYLFKSPEILLEPNKGKPDGDGLQAYWYPEAQLEDLGPGLEH